jgi:catechol 2,3-dioxygenase-like lactoylglutathione lyase family enzyme
MVDRALTTHMSHQKGTKMNLGAFSISLAVKDIAASRAFYEKLGFEQVLGDQTQNWLILRNGETTVGLFQGMFERNLLTFNPGWNSQAELLKKFEDIREIQRSLKASGLALASEADESTAGPTSLTLIDPDGNPILIDQHVE